MEEEEPKPLPHLDYKIVVGNSLVSKLDDTIIDIDWKLTETTSQTHMFGNSYLEQRKEILKQITTKQKQVFEPNSNQESLSLGIRNLKIDLLINQLKLMIKTDGLDAKPNLTNKKQKQNTEIWLKTLGWKDQVKKLYRLKKDTEADLTFFDWKLDFPEVMNPELNTYAGFDIVIGNPPYLGEKNNKKIFEPLKRSRLGYKFYLGKMDLYYFFFHLGLDLLKKNSGLSYITTNYYLTATGGKKLRNDIRKRSSIIKLINFNEYKIFENALGQHNLITMLKKDVFNLNTEFINLNFRRKRSNDDVTKILNGEHVDCQYGIIKQKNLFNSGNITIEDQSINEILSKISENKILGELADVKVGLRTGLDKISKRHNKINNKFEVGSSVFVISKDEISHFHKSDHTLIKPLFKNSNINRWLPNYKYESYVIYVKKTTKIQSYKSIYDHLLKFKDIIEKTRNNKNEIWYSIVRPRTESIFTGEKIVCSQRSKTNDFAYDDSIFFSSSDVYFIKNPKNNISIKFLLGVLNSKLIYTWLYWRGKRKGEMLELYQEPLSNIPIKKMRINRKFQIM